MLEGMFKFQDDPLKHHIRLNGWLPVCRDRLGKVRKRVYKKSQTRRLRYFTFCAVGARDVLLLDIENVINRNKQGHFDLVTFFDKNPIWVGETQKRIPGAVGFPGNFIEVVLLNDPNENASMETDNPLESPEDEEDRADTRRRQKIIKQKHDFIRRFPFDVINLDLEEFLFKPNDPMPGDVVRAIGNIANWQKNPFRIPQSGEPQTISEFSLFFTTQVGPSNISTSYLDMLETYLVENIKKYSELNELLITRVGESNTTTLRNEQFDAFFKLSMPKVLANILLENDWYVDPDRGIVIYEIDRPAENGIYTILHLLMDVKRKNPPQELRAPNTDSEEAIKAYKQLTIDIFNNDTLRVSEDSIDIDTINESLGFIRSREKKYISGE